MFEGIYPLDEAHQPTFPKARAFVERCTQLLDPDGTLPAARFELPRLLGLAPYVCILGVIDDGKDFVVRLAGTKFVSEFLGADPTGVRLSATLQGEFGERSWYLLRESVRRQRPMLNQPGRTRFKPKEFMRLETVNWPLVDATGRVIKIAGFYDYFFEKEPAAV